jgi:hypothetical protein
LARATTLGTNDALGLVAPDLGIDVDVLLEQPDREVTAQFDGPLFPLVEGHELILVPGIEHQVEGSGGVDQPALAKGLVGLVGLRSRVVHRGSLRVVESTGLRLQPIIPPGPTAETRMHPQAS